MLNKNNKLRHSISLAAVMALSGLSATAWADAYEDAAKNGSAANSNRPR